MNGVDPSGLFCLGWCSVVDIYHSSVQGGHLIASSLTWAYNSALVQGGKTVIESFKSTFGEIKETPSDLENWADQILGEAEYYANELWIALGDLLTDAGEAGAATPSCPHNPKG